MTTNRKDKIKNIAIIFLLIMLVLTFFSNTIMNYSLVEVSTQQVVSGTITSKVRGSGTVEAGDSYNVTIDESRKIATVNVRTGREVETGDVLFTLEDSESEELKAARNSLRDAQNAYETAVLAAGITVAERQNIESGKSTSLTEKQNAIASAQKKVDDAQAAVDAAQVTINSISAQVAGLESSSVDTTSEELKKLETAKKLVSANDDLSSKATARDNARSAYESAQAMSGASGTTSATTGTVSAEELERLRVAYESAESEYRSALSNYNDCKKADDDAQYAIDVKKLNGNNTAQSNSLQAQLTAATADKTAKETALADAQADLAEVTAKINGEVTVATAYAAVQELQDEVSEYEEKSIGAEITSPISGTVTEIFYTAGQTAEAAATMMTIQPENKAFVLNFNVSQNQAKKIKAGDSAEIINNWYSSDISAKVLSIRRDAMDKSQNVVTCELSGDVSVGDNYTLSIGESSSNYDLIVPTNTIREDSNGSFILIIESKDTPLGSRYYARRVDVEVITSDDSKSAITGALEGYEYVITTTTKPIEENQQVRLATE